MIVRADATPEIEPTDGPYRTAAKLKPSVMEFNIQNMESKVEDIASMAKELEPVAKQFRQFVKTAEARLQGIALEDEFETEALVWELAPSGQGHFYIKTGLVGGPKLRNASNIELLRYVGALHALLNKMQANLSHHVNKWEGRE